MAIDYVALASEINTDPAALGYAAPKQAGNDIAVAVLLNAVGAGVSFQVNREPISSALFIANMDPTEFAALTQAQLLRLLIILSGDSVDINGANTQTSLLGIFPNPGATKTAIAALLKRQGSRAEVLFGRGTVITGYDVAHAFSRS